MPGPIMVIRYPRLESLSTLFPHGTAVMFSVPVCFPCAVVASYETESSLYDNFHHQVGSSIFTSGASPCLVLAPPSRRRGGVGQQLTVPCA